jgi:AraC-like DNA-binding protein
MTSEMGINTMTYKRPLVQKLDTLDTFFDHFLPKILIVPADKDWRAQKLERFIDSHSGPVRWNLDNVCRQLGLTLSGRHARRLFKVSTGVGVREYAKQRRLAFAAKQLHATNIPVKAIAADLGYQSTCHFARSFKELFLLSPLEFRTMWRRREIAAH